MTNDRACERLWAACTVHTTAATYIEQSDSLYRVVSLTPIHPLHTSPQFIFRITRFRKFLRILVSIILFMNYRTFVFGFHGSSS